jgi:hypothetical protein
MKTETKEWIGRVTSGVIFFLIWFYMGHYVGSKNAKVEQKTVVEKQELEWWNYCDHANQFWITVDRSGKFPNSVLPKKHMVRVYKGVVTHGHVDPIEPTNGVINIEKWPLCKICTEGSPAWKLKLPE